MRQPIKPRIVGNEAHHALSGLGNASLGHAEKADVEVVEPLPFGTTHPLSRAVGFRQFPLFVHRHPRKAVVGRIAENYENRRVLFHPLGAVAFLLQFEKRQRLGRTRLPASQRIGQKHLGAFRSVIGQCRVECLHGQPNLQVSNDKRRGHDLKAEHALSRRLFDPRPNQRTQALIVQIGGDAAQHLGQIRPGAAARIEHIDIFRGQPIGQAEIVPQSLVHAGYHVAHHFGWRVPDAELFPQVGVKGLEEWLVEIRDGLAFVEAGKEGVAIHPVERRRCPVEHFNEAERLQPTGLR